MSSNWPEDTRNLKNGKRETENSMGVAIQGGGERTEGGGEGRFGI